jgi:hypothetical protein
MTASSSKASTKATTEDSAAPSPAVAPAGGDTVTAAPLDGSPAATAAAATAVPADDNRVPIKLAHPIDTVEAMRRLRIEPKEDGTPYAVGETVRLFRDEARALINCGYAQVDPEDANAVRRAIFPEKFVDSDAAPTA